MLCLKSVVSINLFQKWVIEIVIPSILRTMDWEIKYKLLNRQF